MTSTALVFKQTNENMELTSAIQSEHVKKEVARKLGQLQEDIHNMKEQVKTHTLSPKHTHDGHTDKWTHGHGDRQTSWIDKSKKKLS